VARPGRGATEPLRHALLVLGGLVGLASLVFQYGIEPNSARLAVASLLRDVSVGLFLLELLLAALFLRPWQVFWRARLPALVLSVLLLGEAAVVHFGAATWLAPFLRFFTIRSAAQAYVILFQFYIGANLLVSLASLQGRLSNRRVRTAFVFLLAFVLLILTGAGLLSLPRMTPEARLPTVDALFTSTSAVCVTGLVVRDTATEFTRLGQMIILLLIQLGGLGIMSLGATISLLLGRGIGIRESSLLRDVLQLPLRGEVTGMIRFIVLYTFAVEFTGMLLIYWGLNGVVTDPAERLFQAAFHSISAFCNAGFSSLEGGLVPLASNDLVVGTVAGLLIVGGVGFTVVANLLAYGRGVSLGARGGGRAGRISIQTRVVLRMTLFLLLGGMLGIALLEWDSGLAGANFGRKLGLAFFQSATARTAGFNTLDLTLLDQPALFLLIALMFVGAAPGSTAGGIKITTLAVLWANIRAIARGYQQPRLMDRDLSPDVMRRAVVVLTGSLLTAAIGIFALLITERTELMTTTFEAISALGTVGLSLGLTPFLTVTGRVIIIVLMFVGRLGPLTFAYGLVARTRERNVRLPEASMMIG
jgi:trk system potassium uptake protein TrkH